MAGNAHSGRKPKDIPQRDSVRTSVKLSWEEHRALRDYAMLHRPTHLNDLFLRWIREGMRREKIVVHKG